jgi:glycosyltransferase involved in cell wall biosynthesis
MHFSLILATINRVSDVADFLHSLSRQSYGDFDLIIVDQNTDSRLDPLVSEYEKRFRINRIFTLPGLSRSRNVGLPLASGDIIAFPDDDCVYPEWLLEEVNKFLSANHQFDGVTGRSIPMGMSVPFRDTPIVFLTPFNVWQRSISYTIFLRKNVISSVKTFDETLGAGAGTMWGAGEETDFLLRAIGLNHKLVQHPGLLVNHPNKSEPPEAAISRAYRYSCGVGRVLRKNSNFPLAAAYSVLRTCVGLFAAAVSGDLLKFRIAIEKLRGKLRGILSSPQSDGGSSAARSDRETV